MNLLKDMALFVQVVQSNGMASAARILSMTPSAVTTRINKLEKHLEVKLLTRTTRSIRLTDVGNQFYEDCLITLENVKNIENKIKSESKSVSGPLRISVTSDFGRQYILPLINEFITQYPQIKPYLNISDAVTHLTNDNIDIGIRYGISKDSTLIAKKLADNYRVLCASPEYLEKYGTPISVDDLKNHKFLTMEHAKKPICTWHLKLNDTEQHLNITPHRSCDDGELIRLWAIQGAGIALKSVWDVVNDLKNNTLVRLLPKYEINYRESNANIDTNLYVVYKDRQFLPMRTTVFINQLIKHFSNHPNNEFIKNNQ